MTWVWLEVKTKYYNIVYFTFLYCHLSSPSLDDLVWNGKPNGRKRPFPC